MSENINITLPDGNKIEIAKSSTGYDIAYKISESLAKEAVAVIINNQIKDLFYPIESNSDIEIIKRSNDEALELIRHDCAHVMAEAVQELYPGTQVTIGPAIKDGFYYDFYREKPFAIEDLESIEKKMSEIIDRGDNFEREVWTKKEAIKFFLDQGENYKAEIIKDLPGDEDITIYRQGKWLDLCRGPHLPSTHHIGKAFKLLNVAGAYWRGDENNVMLTRIYGTAWRNAMW